MGCDIHLFLESQQSDGTWESCDVWEPLMYDGKVRWGEPRRALRTYTHGRNYNLFAALAGARKWHFLDCSPPASPPKGVPEDMSIPVSDYYKLGEGNWHTPSWLTTEEILSYDFSQWGDTCNEFLSEVVPKMQEIDRYGKARIVFWFDN